MLRTIFFFVIIVSTIGQLNAQQVLDTVYTDKGPMVIYSNRTWAFLKDRSFTGILNEQLHNLLNQQLGLNFTNTWSNDVCFTSGKHNDMSKLSDTLWLCVLDEAHKDFVAPVPGMVTSRYGFRHGRHHSGIDLDLETGDTVRSCWAGKVRYSKYNDGGFGNLVVVRHYNGLETFYAHLSKLLVAPDQEVKAGEVIGLGGNTGRSYGSHLHFEVRFYDAAINPEEVIDFEKRMCKDANLFVHKGLFRPGAKPSTVLEGEEPELIEKQEDPVEKQIEAAQAVQTTLRKYYKIKSGDTLTEIADRNQTTVSKICQLNGIRPSSTLQVGRSLRVK
jgi:murein DD-endopeptidase MepM/ murein hydrolase activator NlpD